MDAPSIELELRQTLARGDRRRAASLLVEHYADDVLACCRAMLRDRTTAEDLAQDTFGRAIAALATFRGESSPRTWLLSIARNGCLDFLRRKRASPIEDDEAEPDEHAAPAPAALERLVRREDVERALGPLGETERALVVLHYGHGVGYPELAEAFSLKEGAVRMRMSRAVEKMREALTVAEEVAEEVAMDTSAMSAPAPARAMPAARRVAPAPGAPPAPGPPPAESAPRGRGWWPFGKPAEAPAATRARRSSGGAPAPASSAAPVATVPSSSPAGGPVLRERASDSFRSRLLVLVATA